MFLSYEKMLKLFSVSERSRLLHAFNFGLEREVLRTDMQGDLAQTVHPKVLGSPLTHPYISTDFAEAQLELITPPFKSHDETLDFLEDLHAYVVQNMGNEMLWPLSTPCPLPDPAKISIAQYGTSKRAQKKMLYRAGLANRYGKNMQAVSGIHYNFSARSAIKTFLAQELCPERDYLDFKNEFYLSISRNFTRYNAVYIYLFGASPVVHQSYLAKREQHFFTQGKNCLIAPYATSLRMSHYGYQSHAQSRLFIPLDHLNSYVDGLKSALKEPYRKYHKEDLPPYSLQLNDRWLQNEWEYYSLIRLKQIPHEQQSLLQALEERGILYLELRTLDLDPFTPLGIDKEQASFLHLLICYCFFKESPLIDQVEDRSIKNRQHEITLFGRKPSLQVEVNGHKHPFKAWGISCLEEMLPLANLLDQDLKQKVYCKVLYKQIEKFRDPSLTPSARFIEQMKGDYLSFASELSAQHKQYLKNKVLTPERICQLHQLTDRSIYEQKLLEKEEEHCNF